MEEKELSNINILDILKALLNKWWIIVVSSIIGTLGFFIYFNYFTVQEYKASTSYYVNSSLTTQISTSISAGQLTASRSLVDTYEIIVKSYTTLEEVLDKTNIENTEQQYHDQIAVFGTDKLSKEYTTDDLKSMISISSINETEVFTIEVTGTNQADVYILANAFISPVTSKLSTIINGSEAKNIDDVHSVTAISKKIPVKALIGFIIGFVVSAGLVFIFDVLVDDTIDSIDWVKETFKGDMPLLAVIPDTSEDSNSRSYGYYRRKKSYYYYEADNNYSTENKDEGGKK